MVLTVLVAILGTHYDVIDYVFYHDLGLWQQAGWKSFHDEHVKRVKFLLWLGADPAFVNQDQRGQVSVLENAVEWSNFKIIDILLPLLPEDSRAGAMDYACRRGIYDSIVFLKEKGITPSHPVVSDLPKEKLPGVCFGNA